MTAKKLKTPTDLPDNATKSVADALNGVLADSYALYLKTKNFHWHMSGPHFRDYHLMLDDQATELFAMTDPLAERIRKLGGKTLRSIGHVSRLQRIPDNDEEFVEPSQMLSELCDNNRALVIYFVYYLTIEQGQSAATATAVNRCFSECDLTHPQRTSRISPPSKRTWTAASA